MTLVIAKIAGSLAALGAAACLGAYLRPPRIETREATKDVVKYVDRVEYRDRVQYVDREKIVRRVVRMTVAADGTKITESTTDTGVSEKTAAQETTASKEARREAERVQERTELRPAEREWAAGVLAGVDGLQLRSWVGASLSRRILGPVEVTVIATYEPGDNSVRAGGGFQWRF